jgi:hypothetical protein
MGQERKINTKELEKHIIHVKEEEKRRKKDYFFQTILVVACMFGVYFIFKALGSESKVNDGFQKEVKNTETHSKSSQKTK